jgi:hypothetical protein
LLNGIPGEIRNKIYDLVLGNVQIHIDSSWPANIIQDSIRGGDFSYIYNPLALTRTCRQIAYETKFMILKRNEVCGLASPLYCKLLMMKRANTLQLEAIREVMVKLPAISKGTTRLYFPELIGNPEKRLLRLLAQTKSLERLRIYLRDFTDKPGSIAVRRLLVLGSIKRIVEKANRSSSMRIEWAE